MLAVTREYYVMQINHTLLGGKNNAEGLEETDVRILLGSHVHTSLDEFETVLKFVWFYMSTRNRINYETKSVHTEVVEL
jgi:hypothetical protein